jgi:hypothetical protein
MTRSPSVFSAISIAMVASFTASGANAVEILNWSTVANNTMLFPGDTRAFNSYNQPSVNNNGLVVFRARTQGGSGSPASGILTRDMATAGNPIVVITQRGAVVPAPNNTDATFNEFPSIPRIDARSNTIATRGQSKPVLEYQVGIDPSTNEPITTKGGTSGIYTNPTGALISGMTGLGNVNNSVYPSNPDFSYFQVPNLPPGTKFDQFPGAPSPTGNMVVFKGNWTEGTTGGTGVYYRDVVADGGTSPVKLIADSKTDIPGFAGTKFGSTAPPSADNGRMVFLGLDNEEAPTKGGIYMAELSSTKAPDTASLLKTLVTIGGAVVDKSNAFFTKVGEALSFGGSKVGYWGAWGQKDAEGNLTTETRAVNVSCGSIENAMTASFCLAQDDGTTLGSGIAGDGIYTFDVAKDQGFFITDVDTLETRIVAETGSVFSDFVYWNFSGHIPGEEGEEDGEFARWRSASFIASDEWNAVFRGDKLDGSSGLYSLFNGNSGTIAELGMDGGLLDSAASGLAISSLGIERDGFRNGWLVINSSMTDGITSMAGVYVANVPEPDSWALMIAGFGLTGAVMRRRRQALA